jgi:hypothetical protein
MLLGAVLGANLWIVTVALPVAIGLLSAGALPGRGAVALVAVSALGPLVLGWGILRRGTTELLVAFPAVLMLPQVLTAVGEATARRVPPAPLVVTAISLCGYLFAVARGLERTRSTGPQPLKRTSQPLGREEMAPRWQRRLRVYGAFTVVAVLFPVALVGYIGVWPGAAAFEESFVGRVEAAQTMLVAGAALLWMLVFRGDLIQPLYGHLQHDREVLAIVEVAKRQARRKRPRPTFYFFTAVLLAMAAALLWLRSK